MSNIVRDSDSLGKSNEKKWSHNKKNTNKGCKIAELFFIGEFRLNKSVIIKSILQRAGAYTTRIRRLYKTDQEVIQQGSGGY